MKHLEYNEQKAFIDWCKLATRLYPVLGLIYCNHNTQKLNFKQAFRWQSVGGKAGIPDLFLPVARDGYYGFYLEFKSPDLKPKTSRSKGGLNDDQLELFPKLKEQGYQVVVCYSWLDAKKELEKYLLS